MLNNIHQYHHHYMCTFSQDKVDDGKGKGAFLDEGEEPEHKRHIRLLQVSGFSCLTLFL